MYTHSDADMEIIGRLSNQVSEQIAKKTRLNEDVSWALTNLIVVLTVTLLSFISILVWEPDGTMIGSYTTLALFLLLVVTVLVKRFE